MEYVIHSWIDCSRVMAVYDGQSQALFDTYPNVGKLVAVSVAVNGAFLGQNQDDNAVANSYLVGAGRFELPTSWSQTRRPAAGPRPDLLNQELYRLLLGRGSLYTLLW